MTTISEWAGGLSDWKSDALRRQVEAAALSDDNYAAIFCNAKAAFGIGTANGQARCGDLTVPEADVDGDVVTLLSVGPMTGVDRLASDQTLSFAGTGITAIYGNNGVGKSGYSRVLKQLCRAVQGSKTALRGNAFEQKAVKPPAVGVAFKVGSKPADIVEWQYGTPPPRALRRISIFDSASARLYVNEQNEIDYLPWQVDLVAGHRRTLERVKLDATRSGLEISAFLNRPLPAFRPQTAVAKTVSRLGLTGQLPSESELRSAGEWNETYQASLDGLYVKLHSDPVMRHAAMKMASEKVRALAHSVYRVERLFRATNVHQVKALELAVSDAAEVLRVAGSLSLGSSPISKTGSSLWKALFLSARKFAIEAEYQNPFSHSDVGDLCVLCQQPLDVDAAKRLQRFDDFVSNQAAQTLAKCQEELLSALSIYKSLEIQDVEDVQKAVQLVDSGVDTSPFQKGTGLLKLIKDLDSQNLNAAQMDVARSNMPTRLGAELARLARAIELNAMTTLSEASPEQTVKIKTSIDELEDRKLLSTSLVDLVARRAKVVESRALSKLVADCSEASLAKFITLLRRNLLTDDTTKRISEEMLALGLSGLPVSFSDKTKADKSLGGVALTGMTLPLKNSDILSEGEQRALALSVFLAEIRAISNSHAVIIDDPVSSLDDARLRKVAARLAELGKERQVVVFTHSMSFFSELRDAALHAKCEHRSHYMFRSAGGFGTLEKDSVPWELKKLKERIAQLRIHLSEISPDSPPEQYKLQVKLFSTMLRESWERLVEEKLLYEVVVRYARPVHTLKLRGVAVTDEDFEKVHYAMKRVSEWSGHDAPIGAAVEPPTLSELSADVDDLAAYAKQLDQARQAVEDKRKALVPA